MKTSDTPVTTNFNEAVALKMIYRVIDFTTDAAVIPHILDEYERNGNKCPAGLIDAVFDTEQPLENALIILRKRLVELNTMEDRFKG